MNWIASIPAGVWYGLEGLVLLALIGVLIIAVYAISKGIRVKRTKSGDTEIDVAAPEAEKTEPPAPGAQP